jgi:hypothetical protein
MRRKAAVSQVKADARWEEEIERRIQAIDARLPTVRLS